MREHFESFKSEKLKKCIVLFSVLYGILLMLRLYSFKLLKSVLMVCCHSTLVQCRFHIQFVLSITQLLRLMGSLDPLNRLTTPVG